MIFDVISKYHLLLRLDKHHRYKSWEHCYRYFNKNFISVQNEEVLDHGCLHLAFYLASWGMLRGGAFLLQKDYRVHEYFLKEVVTKSHYHKYYDRELHLNMNKISIEGIDELIQDTTDAFINNIPQINGEDKMINVTDTLASKILLGVYGNVPAYDRYLKAALKRHGIKQQFDEESLMEIVDFYYLNRDEFEKCQRLFREDGSTYTPMKLVDMYFWQVGYFMDNPDDYSEELKKVDEFIAGFYLARGSVQVKSVSKNAGSTEKIREYIIEVLNQAKAQGVTIIDLRSGDIHKNLKLANRMPSICSAMVSLGAFNFEIINDTPSGASSTKVVRYFLK
ncbi:hypothetical protein GCM10008018_45600 [Paenibacillus marchantiophytorum]|uniref:Uncharacterized protein n=1 Tax=Paenibacillus marchantiophytorum TaxID=1619310 RepID=A0ABQ1EZC0_9BACL|nr:hypothetical protein [Paenibacillus marchantiophytorum]GFZ94018.1 hypothetical protein GCM10008018_45600 [Paenibacillus marchantiophytorum]